MQWLDDLLRTIERGAEVLRSGGEVRVRVPAFEQRGGAVNGYNFTERVRHALALSREESHALQHEYVGTEHILLGIIREGGGVAIAVLQNLSANPDEIRRRVHEVVKEGRPNRHTGPDLPYTSRAKKVLELAMSEARELNHSYVGTEHLLLGLIREGRGIAAQILADYGVTLERAREETIRLLGTEMPREAVGASPPHGGEIRLRSVPAESPRSSARLPRPPGTRSLDASEVRRLEAEADKIELETDWLHVRNVIELGERTGVPVRLEPAPDGVLWLVLGDNLLRVRVPGSTLPPSAEPPRPEGDS